MTISALDKYLERMEKYSIYEPKGGRNVWGVWYSEASYYQLQHSKKRLSWVTPSTFNLRLTCIYFWDIIENWRQKSSYLEITKTSEKNSTIVMSSEICDKQQNVILINNFIFHNFIPPASLLSRNSRHFTDLVKLLTQVESQDGWAVTVLKIVAVQMTQGLKSHVYTSRLITTQERWSII